MNDEMRQIRSQLFSYIISGLIVTALVILISGAGFSNTLFLRGLLILAIALLAIIKYRADQLVVATYILVSGLLIVMANIMLQASSIDGFIPYLFIPIVFVTLFSLTPAITAVTAVLSIAVIFVIVLITGQLSLANLLILAPPMLLLFLNTLFVIKNVIDLKKLDKLLLMSRGLLHKRTLELMELERVVKLERQSSHANLKSKYVGRTAGKKEGICCDLVNGIIQEVDASVKRLEYVVEEISTIPGLDEQAHLFDKGWRQLDHLTNLAVNLQAAIQLENNRVVLQYETINLADMVAELVEITKGLARGKDLEIGYQLPENMPELQADHTRLRQALLYILSNAVKYTNRGTIEIQAEVEGAELIISVSDTGVGIKQEELETIFQKFVRGTNTATTLQNGAGLGLSISKMLVELHRGQIWGTAIMGLGSTFYIKLPFKTLPQTIHLLPPIATCDDPDNKVKVVVNGGIFVDQNS